MKITFRDAELSDSNLIMTFIRELAIYEKLEHEVVAQVEDIQESLFGDNPKAFCIIAESDGKPCGFCLCFYNYSTFLGKAGIYIEDLFVLPEYRGNGAGRGFFKYLATKAQKENCGRVQWSVLNWNEPSINFYKAMGASPLDDWTVYRLEGENLKKLAA